jgi:uncharacterized membrane protein
MKTLFKILVLLTCVVLGYVFSNTIDAKLKSKLGDERVEKFKVQVKKTTVKTVEVGKAMGNAAYVAGKEALDSTKTE